MRPHFEVNGSGPPILFITCPGVTREYWAPQVARLKRYWTCITYDLRGHGRSPYSPRAFTSAGLADDLVELLDGAGYQAPLLCAYSAGCSIALQMLNRHPDRATGAVCIGGYHKADTFYLRSRVAAAVWAAKAGLTGLITRAIVSANSANPAHKEAMLRAARVDCKAFVHLYRSSLREDLTEQLGLIRQPVLLVYGANDHHLLERYGRRMLRLLPNARLTVVPDADHRVPSRQPQVFADLLDGFAREVVAISAGPARRAETEVGHALRTGLRSGAARVPSGPLQGDDHGRL